MAAWYLVAVECQAEDEPEGAGQHDPDGDIGRDLFGQRPGREDLVNRAQRPCHIADFARAVREDDAHSGDDLHSRT